MKYPLIATSLAVAGIVLAYTVVHGQSFSGSQELPAPAAPAPQLMAQTPVAPPATAPSAPATPPADPSTPQVDETALRYFAQQGDAARVEAEIARLRAIYPDWEPPQNLLTEEFVADPGIEAIWELYSNGDYAGARAAIAEKQASDPAFVPSEDLLASLSLGEAGVKLRNASDAAQYEAVISIAANTPALLTCAYIDNLWRLAEAFINTDATQRGIDAYNYILTSCTVPEERFATIQKASVVLDRAELEPLLALEQAGPDGVGEFAPLRLDFARNAVAEVLTGKVARIAADDLARLQASAEATDNPEDLRLLGWYALNQKRPAQGIDWFEAAMEADPSMLSAHGVAVASLDLGRPADAEAVLVDYLDDSEEMTTLYLTAAASLLAREPRVDLDADILARIVERASEARSATVAQELGWYAYAFVQPQTAIAWFRLSLSWDPDQEAAAYGLLVASDAIRDTVTVQSLKAQWGARSPRIAAFGTAAAATTPSQIVPAPVAAVAPVQPAPVVQAAATPPAAVQAVAAQPVRTAAPSGGGGRGSANCAQFVPPSSLSASQALNRAWCLMDLQRPTDAIANFERALQSGDASVRSDAAYGQSLAYIRLGLSSNAAVAASAAPIAGDRATELQVAILTQSAIQSYELFDYKEALVALDERAHFAPEQNDLLVMRAWSYFHLKRYRESERIFEAVASAGHGPAVEGLEAARGALEAQSYRREGVGSF